MVEPRPVGGVPLVVRTNRATLEAKVSADDEGTPVAVLSERSFRLDGVMNVSRAAVLSTGDEEVPARRGPEDVPAAEPVADLVLRNGGGDTWTREPVFVGGHRLSPQQTAQDASSWAA